MDTGIMIKGIKKRGVWWQPFVEKFAQMRNDDAPLFCEVLVDIGIVGLRQNKMGSAKKIGRLKKLFLRRSVG